MSAKLAETRRLARLSEVQRMAAEQARQSAMLAEWRVAEQLERRRDWQLMRESARRIMTVVVEADTVIDGVSYRRGDIRPWTRREILASARVARLYEVATRMLVAVAEISRLDLGEPSEHGDSGTTALELLGEMLDRPVVVSYAPDVLRGDSTVTLDGSESDRDSSGDGESVALLSLDSDATGE